MELPDDVLVIVREYAKPSEPYKMYTRILKILLHGMPLDMRQYTTQKLKTATRFHFVQFRHLFIQLERCHAELIVSEMRMEYYFILRHFASKRREVMNKIKIL